MILYNSIITMNNKHRKTFKRLMTKPILANIRFDDVDKLLIKMGYERLEREGSRVAYGIGDDEIVIHKPHPNNEIKKYVIKKLQDFIKTTETRL